MLRGRDPGLSASCLEDVFLGCGMGVLSPQDQVCEDQMLEYSLMYIKLYSCAIINMPAIFYG
jgi:hypothetical protein